MVLADDDGTRATVTARWLRQLGWDAHVLTPDAARTETGWPAAAEPAGWPELAAVPAIDAQHAQALLGQGALLLDAADSAAFRAAHARGARWANRSALDSHLAHAREAGHVIVSAPDDRLARLLALEFLDVAQVSILQGGLPAWQRSGLPVDASPQSPPDEQRIDFLTWLHDRHEGNAQASAAYLQWELDLPGSVGEASAAGFRFQP
ncbi:MAG: hypothetical protein GAK30_01687 [Paracidovorax wautersii]|uniref:Rhodanese domain-containing protein n=1 Tax=Paracidovorax wautersii TaxID=1177982 RepID=A0A7V8JQE9_9BURK|nr:MAG: hypothetical protein GAK30_01687 [Paracidovorax wautersii]